MKRLTVLAAIIMAVSMTGGCAFRLLNSDVTTETTTVPTNGIPVTVTVQNEVTALSGTMLVNAEVDKADVKWGDVQIGVGGVSSKGDVATVKVISEAAVIGAIAYLTGGSGAVAPAVTKVLKGPESKTVTDSVLSAFKSTSPAEEIKDTSKDVAPGKYGIVVLGNRKGCPLCRALWQPAFEADVEKALPDADVVDADMTDNPKLYSKYFPSESFVYPYAIVFDAAGKRVGAFTARGVDAAGFAAKVSEICKSGTCKPTL